MTKLLVLLGITFFLSVKSYASDCIKCHEGLDKNRMQLELLVKKLKSLGVDADVASDALTSRLEEHAVLEAKIVHFQKQLRELIPVIQCYHHQ